MKAILHQYKKGVEGLEYKFYLKQILMPGK